MHEEPLICNVAGSAITVLSGTPRVPFQESRTDFEGAGVGWFDLAKHLDWMVDEDAEADIVISENEFEGEDSKYLSYDTILSRALYKTIGVRDEASDKPTDYACAIPATGLHAVGYL